MAHSYPNFLVVGMMKAGTTSVYEHLASHPQVKAAQFKELHYFTRDFGMPLPVENWAQEYSELLNVSPDDPEGTLYGEASPSYIAVAPRIAHFNPSCKIIIMLRDRLDRAISQYRQYASFQYRIDKTKYLEEARNLIDAGRGAELDIVRDSIYEDRIEEFFKNFSSGNIILGSFEYFRSEPQKFMSEIFDNLKINDFRINPGVRGAKTEKHQNEEELGRLIKPLLAGHTGEIKRIIAKHSPITIQSEKHSLDAI